MTGDSEPDARQTKPPASDELGDESPIDRLLDMAVYAPLGFALERRRLLPELADAGRRQVAFSRSLGRAALRTIARSAARTEASKVEPPASRPARGSEHDRADSALGEVAGFTEMSAKEVVALLSKAQESTVSWIATAEAAAKRRKTVLAAVERARARL